jgi:RNA polymerase sigma-70 factor (ECF subfamily)
MCVPSESPAITVLLRRWRAGDQDSLNELVPLVQDELRNIAHRHMRSEGRGHTLQTTALINEAYLRLLADSDVDWQSRAHFMAIAARLMRQILVDYARRGQRGKRAPGREVLPLNESLVFAPSKGAQLLELNDALQKLAKVDERKASVVELRYFGGLSVEEAAHVLQVSPNTVIRDWSLAKAWLRREMENSPTHGR